MYEVNNEVQRKTVRRKKRMEEVRWNKAFRGRRDLGTFGKKIVERREEGEKESKSG